MDIESSINSIEWSVTKFATPKNRISIEVNKL